jgi:hypothetical protein
MAWVERQMAVTVPMGRVGQILRVLSRVAVVVEIGMGLAATVVTAWSG